jgi:hypothetical protein
VESILLELRLSERRNIRAFKLSGGEKRKLSVGISLIGDPKVRRSNQAVDDISYLIIFFINFHYADNSARRANCSNGSALKTAFMDFVAE